MTEAADDDARTQPRPRPAAPAMASAERRASTSLSAKVKAVGAMSAKIASVGAYVAPEAARRGRLGGPVTAVCLAAAGTEIVAACADKSLRCYDAASGACLALYEKLEGEIAALCSDGEDLVFSGGSDGTIVRWTLSDGPAAGRSLSKHDGPVLSVAYEPRRGAVLSGSRDGTARAWDAASGAELLRVGKEDGITGPVTALAGPPPGADLFAFACGDLDPAGTEHFVFVRRGLGEEAARWRVPDRVWAMCLAPDLSHLFLGHQGGTITVWSLAEQRCTATLEGHSPKQVSQLALIPGALVSSGFDRRVLLWSLPPGSWAAPHPAPARESTSHSGAVNGVALRPDGDVFTAGFDHRVHRLPGFAVKPAGMPEGAAAAAPAVREVELVPPSPVPPLTLVLYFVVLLAEHVQMLKSVVENLDTYNYRRGLVCPVTGALFARFVEPALGHAHRARPAAPIPRPHSKALQRQPWGDASEHLSCPVSGITTKGYSSSVVPYWLAVGFMVSFVGVMLACFKGLYGLVLKRSTKDRLGAFLRAALEGGLWFVSMILSADAVEQVAQAFSCVEGQFTPAVSCWRGAHWPHVFVGPLVAVPFVLFCLRLVAVEGRLMNYGYHLFYWGNDNTAAVMINVHLFSRRSAFYERLRLALAMSWAVGDSILRDHPVPLACFQATFLAGELLGVLLVRPFYAPKISALRACMYLGLAISPLGVIASEYGWWYPSASFPPTCSSLVAGQAAVPLVFGLWWIASLLAAAAGGLWLLRPAAAYRPLAAGAAAGTEAAEVTLGEGSAEGAGRRFLPRGGVHAQRAPGRWAAPAAPSARLQSFV
eukprot:tig00021168_g19127.t1